MKKPTKNMDRAYAVISCIGATLKSADSPSYELKIVQDRVNKMMQVYNVKVGKKHYWEVSNKVKDVWTELASRHSNIVSETSVCVLAEVLCNLLHKKTFEELLACTQPEIHEGGISKEDFRKICQSSLSLSDEFNKIFGTKNIVYTISKPKAKKVKKEKVKKKSKAQLKHEEEQEKIRIAKENKKKALQEMIRKAKEKRSIND